MSDLFSTLPAPLSLYILLALSDFKALYAAILSSPHLWAVFRLDARQIFRTIVARSLPEGLVTPLLTYMLSREHLTRNHHSTSLTLQQLQLFAYMILHSSFSAPSLTILAHSIRKAGRSKGTPMDVKLPLSDPSWAEETRAIRVLWLLAAGWRASHITTTSSDDDTEFLSGPQLAFLNHEPRWTMNLAIEVAQSILRSPVILPPSKSEKIAIRTFDILQTSQIQLTKGAAELSETEDLLSPSSPRFSWIPAVPTDTSFEDDGEWSATIFRLRNENPELFRFHTEDIMKKHTPLTDILSSSSSRKPRLQTQERAMYRSSSSSLCESRVPHSRRTFIWSFKHSRGGVYKGFALDMTRLITVSSSRFLIHWSRSAGLSKASLNCSYTILSQVRGSEHSIDKSEDSFLSSREGEEKASQMTAMMFDVCKEMPRGTSACLPKKVDVAERIFRLYRQAPYKILERTRRTPEFAWKHLDSLHMLEASRMCYLRELDGYRMENMSSCGRVALLICQRETEEAVKVKKPYSFHSQLKVQHQISELKCGIGIQMMTRMGEVEMINQTDRLRSAAQTYCADYQRPLSKYRSTKRKLRGAGADCRDNDVMPRDLQLDVFVAADHASSIQAKCNQVSRPSHRRPLSIMPVRGETKDIVQSTPDFPLARVSAVVRGAISVLDLVIQDSLSNLGAQKRTSQY
ncbi:hypothetical protein KCU87_g548, partial [Aureobasidium melanogenum]